VSAHLPDGDGSGAGADARAGTAQRGKSAPMLQALERSMLKRASESADMAEVLTEVVAKRIDQPKREAAYYRINNDAGPRCATVLDGRIDFQRRELRWRKWTGMQACWDAMCKVGDFKTGTVETQLRLMALDLAQTPIRRLYSIGGYSPRHPGYLPRQSRRLAIRRKQFIAATAKRIIAGDIDARRLRAVRIEQYMREHFDEVAHEMYDGDGAPVPTWATRGTARGERVCSRLGFLARQEYPRTRRGREDGDGDVVEDASMATDEVAAARSPTDTVAAAAEPDARGTGESKRDDASRIAASHARLRSLLATYEAQRQRRLRYQPDPHLRRSYRRQLHRKGCCPCQRDGKHAHDHGKCAAAPGAAGAPTAGAPAAAPADSCAGAAGSGAGAGDAAEDRAAERRDGGRGAEDVEESRVNDERPVFRILFMGDGHFSASRRGHASGTHRNFVKWLARSDGVLVVMVDEYRTSKCCFICGHEVRMHGDRLVHCAECAKSRDPVRRAAAIRDRDINGAANMLLLGLRALLFDDEEESGETEGDEAARLKASMERLRPWPWRRSTPATSLSRD